MLPRPLQNRIPFLDFASLGERPTKRQLTDLLTMEALAHFAGAALSRGER